jgi:hypothetical protein
MRTRARGRAARARSVLFNEDEVKHAGQKQQRQSKKHTHNNCKEQIGWPPENEVDVNINTCRF